MRLGSAVLAALLALAGAAFAQDSPMVTVQTLPTSLAGEWLFRLGHDPAYASPFREKRNWRKVHVPGPWERSGYPGYNGHAWYRLPILFSSDLAHEDLGLDLGLIGDVDEVFLNGRRVGSTGGFPPRFDRAKLVSRVYFIPREAIRFGEYNELAVHVYNEARSGGLLGPSPRIDRADAILTRVVVQNLIAYCLATFLVALALLQIPLGLRGGEASQHLAFAAFLVVSAVMIIAPARWGPTFFLGHGGAFRLFIACLLVSEALLAVPLFGLARVRRPRWFPYAQTILLLAAAFEFVGREGRDILVSFYTAEIAALAVLSLSLGLSLVMLRKRRPWAAWVFGSLVVLCVLGVVDLLTDLTLLPRFMPTMAQLASPLALVPFGAALSLALTRRWVERRWGEPVDSRIGLMNRDGFGDRLALEMERSRRSGQPLAAALIRVHPSESSPDHDQDRARTLATMRRSLRQIDVLGRYDQETFAVVLVDTDERAAMGIIERLRVSVGESAHSEGLPRVRTSAGVAQFRAARHRFSSDLTQEAEAALFAAIAEGGNCTATAP